MAQLSRKRGKATGTGPRISMDSMRVVRGWELGREKGRRGFQRLARGSGALTMMMARELSGAIELRRRTGTVSAGSVWVEWG